VQEGHLPYSHVPAEVIAALPELSATGLRVAVALGSFIHPKGWAWPNQEAIAERAGLESSRAVRMGLVELHEKGLLHSIRPDRRKPTIYAWTGDAAALTAKVSMCKSISQLYKPDRKKRSGRKHPPTGRDVPVEAEKSTDRKRCSCREGARQEDFFPFDRKTSSASHNSFVEGTQEGTQAAGAPAGDLTAAAAPCQVVSAPTTGRGAFFTVFRRSPTSAEEADLAQVEKTHGAPAVVDAILNLNGQKGGGLAAVLTALKEVPA